MEAVGDTINGRYQLTGELGQGAMSIVYSAIDTKLNKPVAVKMLLPHLAKMPEAVSRFQREAAAVAKLDDHPNIVRIYDYSGPDSHPVWLVMELVNGLSLAQFMEKHPLNWPDLAALIIKPLVQALIQAHTHGIIHRDIKPENIMISASGQLKLVDFGIARAADSATMTSTGALMGSPAYMAPEYLNGERPGPAADLYSLGVLLYHLTTSQLPFSASNSAALFKKISEGEFMPPEQVDPRISHELSALICRCMMLDPSTRFASAQELDDELSKVISKLQLVNSENEVTQYFLAPDQFVEKHLGEWLKHQKNQAHTATIKKQLGQALSCYERLLAFDPDDQQLLDTVGKLLKKQRYYQLFRKCAILVLPLILLAVMAIFLWPILRSPPISQSPAVTTITNAQQPESNSDQHNIIITADQNSDQSGQKVAPKTETPTAIAQAHKPLSAENSTGKAKTTVSRKEAKRAERHKQAPIPVTPAVPEPPAETTPVPEEPATPPQPQLIPITFHIFPYATIWIDEQVVAQNAMNPVTVKLAPGPHKIRLTHPAAKTIQETYLVEPDSRDFTFRMQMEPLPARFTADIPNGSIIKVGNNQFVASPITKTEGHLIELPDKQFSYRYKVTVTEPGKKPWEKTVDFKAGQLIKLAH